MAGKDSTLKKRLIKEGIIAGILMIVLVAGGYLLMDYDDDSLSEKQNRENENAGLRSEQESIRQELGTGFEVSAYYEAYIKNHSPVFLLDRESASQLLNGLREKHHLSNLTVTISPVTDAGLDVVHLKSGILTRSEVHLSFGAVTDNSIYGFIEALERTLPGIVAIRDLKFTRTSELSSAVVLALGQHRIMPLVNADLSFVWLGIRPPDAPKAGSPSPSPMRGGLK